MFDFINLTDGYKVDHRRQYPAGTQGVYSNFTARNSRIPGQTHVTFLGLQYFLQEYLMTQAWSRFFCRRLDFVLADYKALMDRYLGPNDIGTDHIAALWGLGYIPLEFCALPEGTNVPLQVPMFTVENTHPDFFWVTNYFETLMSSVLWHGCTSASTARRYRDILTRYSPKEFVPYQAHDFSFRGMSGPEAAALSGAGHLVFFEGTDCLPAMQLIQDHYGGKVGVSVPATEHSVMCAGGQDDELGTYDRLLDLYPTGILSVVSDTWDLWYVLLHILPRLKSKIMARDGKLVIRPDSGDPVKIICGDPDGKSSPEQWGVVDALYGEFGGTVDKDGLKVLDSHIGTIYGDSITEERAEQICQGLIAKGFSPANVVFGVGSYTYQYVTRDTHGFAIKATWTKCNGVEHQLQKNPVTGSGKKSARGRLAVVDDGTGLKLIDGLDHYQQMMHAERNLLKPVWRNGEFLRKTTWAEVRANANKG